MFTQHFYLLTTQQLCNNLHNNNQHTNVSKTNIIIALLAQKCNTNNTTENI